MTKFGKIYTYKDLEEAIKLLEKEVVFSDSLRQITEFPETCRRAKLKRIVDGGNVEQLGFFLNPEHNFYYQFIRDIERPLTPQEFAEKMKRLAESSDLEGMHADMDELMCETLKYLGYEEGIEIFENTEKWYA